MNKNDLRNFLLSFGGILSGKKNCASDGETKETKNHSLKDLAPVECSEAGLPKAKFKRVKGLVLIGIFLVLAVAGIYLFITLNKRNNKKSEWEQKITNVSNSILNKPECKTKAEPDPKTDYITWTLPDCASPLRLSFPYSMDEVFYSNETGLAGYGVHSGEHIEGLNHEWIELRPGTPIRSWADGTVERVDVSGDVSIGEVQIRINYGQNLIATHMEVKGSLVKKGDKVKAGQIIAEGMRFEGRNVTSGEYALVDLNRSDGTVDYMETPSTVSPYDYLREPDKGNLIKAYKEKVLDPFLAGKKVTEVFKPYQPYLTNQLFLHVGNKGKLSGEWYSTKNNPKGDWESVLTFIESDSRFLRRNLVLTRNNHLSDPYSGLKGWFDVDYSKKQFKVYGAMVDIPNVDFSRYATVYYGIFEVNESGERPTLKIEYQTGNYPTDFTSKAETYILRDDGNSKLDSFRK